MKGVVSRWDENNSNKPLPRCKDVIIYGRNSVDEWPNILSELMDEWPQIPRRGMQKFHMFL
jgi:hypothetical protein